ncbi:MAG: sigma 54-interacting transcriptional regulator [Clostridia bacterium]|nr:sigma 54-interacting transcriptional regulator [Clostridia bacterium]
MKKAVVLSTNINTCQAICQQLESLIGDKVIVSGYCLEDNIPKSFENTLVIFAGSLIKELFLHQMHEGTNYLIAKRVINYHYLSHLISLPAGSEVLLVNDHKQSCLTTIEQLNKHGIDHIKYYPYYPGIKDYKRLELGVSIGESQLAPPCVKKIIDIGVRQIDITTLVEILNHLDLMDEKENIISSKFVSDIIKLSKQYCDAANRSKELKNMFQIIVDNSIDGMVYVNTLGEILTVNDAFETMSKIEKKKIIDKKIEDILPELGNWRTEEIDRDVIKINGRNLAVVKVPVKRDENIVGYMIRIEDVVEVQKLEHEVRRKMRSKEHNARYHFTDIVSKSSTMEKTINLAKKFSLSNSPILIQGESGTGKEFFAQSIHNFSNMRKKPFVPVNFAALSMNLLESELFGYEEGAFTGAKKGGKAGLFEEAHGGTILLDEIGDAPLDFQARLLRVLQERQVRRVGSAQLIPVDVRIIVATNKDVRLLVEEGKFRQDLFYRLNVLPLYIPPLRERKEDILILIDTYLRKFTNNKIMPSDKFFSKDALDYLVNYEWPGNIRELVNVVEYIVNIKSDDRLIEISDLPSYVTNDFNKSERLYLPAFYDNHILWLLKKIQEKKGAGRRSLANIAREENLELTEAKIKGLLNKMKQENLIDTNIGVKGCTITEKGNKMLSTIKFDKI